jgi:hypothetical protein
MALASAARATPTRPPAEAADSPAAPTTIQALAVGFGFIAAEIVLLQRLTLDLGQPRPADKPPF